MRCLVLVLLLVLAGCSRVAPVEMEPVAVVKDSLTGEEAKPALWRRVAFYGLPGH